MGTASTVLLRRVISLKSTPTQSGGRDTQTNWLSYCPLPTRSSLRRSQRSAARRFLQVPAERDPGVVRGQFSQRQAASFLPAAAHAQAFADELRLEERA